MLVAKGMIKGMNKNHDLKGSTPGENETKT